jgi:hypothetical protein
MNQAGHRARLKTAAAVTPFSIGQAKNVNAPSAAIVRDGPVDHPAGLRVHQEQFAVRPFHDDVAMFVGIDRPPEPHLLAHAEFAVAKR